MLFRMRSIALALPLLMAASCTESGDQTSIEIRFAPMVGETPFACGQSYDGLGSTGATAQANDFRLYVHDVTVLHSNGSREAIELSDNAWQSEGIVLLDFEDASGECVGSPETNMVIEGIVSDNSDISSIEFTLGVPEADNHLDSASAPAPLNIAGMYWSWMGGYKFVRVDMEAAGGESFVFHLGATGCTGSTADGFACANDNRVTLSLDSFDPENDTIAVDIGALLANADLTTVNDMMVDPIEGCMSGPMDPECPPLFTALGLEHGSDATDPAGQTVFRVVDNP